MAPSIPRGPGRAEALAELIRYHRARYFADGALEISDAEFDELVRGARRSNRRTGLAAADSPLQEVGAPTAATFAPVRHETRMFSLDNAFDREELVAWYGRIERAITDPVRFVGEPKLDGLAISLLYEESLRAGEARGDGQTGRTSRQRRDDRVDPAAARRLVGPGAARGARRGVHAADVVRGAQPQTGGRGRAALRQPAQCRRGQPATEGPRITASRDLSFFGYQLGVKDGGPRSGRTTRRWRGCASSACR